MSCCGERVVLATTKLGSYDGGLIRADEGELGTIVSAWDRDVYLVRLDRGFYVPVLDDEFMFAAPESERGER